MKTVIIVIVVIIYAIIAVNITCLGTDIANKINKRNEQIENLMFDR